MRFVCLIKKIYLLETSNMFLIMHLLDNNVLPCFQRFGNGWIHSLDPKNAWPSTVSCNFLSPNIWIFYIMENIILDSLKATLLKFFKSDIMNRILFAYLVVKSLEVSQVGVLRYWVNFWPFFIAAFLNIVFAFFTTFGHLDFTFGLYRQTVSKL